MNTLSFLIPVRIDTQDRLWNLGVILEYLTTRARSAEVIVIELDAESKIEAVLARYPSVRHLFRSHSGRFAKSEAANMGAMATQRPYICVYDTDVLLHTEAMTTAVAGMENDGWKIVLPFNRVFVDVKGELKRKVAGSFDLDVLGKMKRMLVKGASPEMESRFLGGGIFMAHRETYLAIGGINRKMISYGWEDTEVFKRFLKLGFPPLLLPDYSLVHLDHARGTDSQPGEHYDANRKEYFKICSMSARELEKYVVSDLSLTCLHEAGKVRNILQQQSSAGLRKLFAVRSMLSLLAISINAHGVAGFIKTRLYRS